MEPFASRLFADFEREYGVGWRQIEDMPESEFLWRLRGLSPQSAWVQSYGVACSKEKRQRKGLAALRSLAVEEEKEE